MLSTMNTDNFVNLMVAVIILVSMVIFFLISRRVGKKQISEMAEKLNTFEEACRLSQDALLVVDRSRRIVFTNDAAQKLSPIRLNEPVSQLDGSLEIRMPEDGGEPLTLGELIQRHRLEGSTHRSVFRNVHCGRADAEATIEIETYRSEWSRQVYDIVSIHDQSCEKKLTMLRHLNPSSGLPNQLKAFGDITMLTSKRGERNRFAVMMLELDEADYLRSLYGYAELDNIVHVISNVLRELEKNQKIHVYHLNYVNFMLLVKDPKNHEELMELFNNFQSAVQEKYNLRGQKQRLDFSAGVSIYPDHGTRHSLFNSAYNALSQARERGTGQIVIAGKSFDKQTNRELQLNNEIRSALDNNEFSLYFQPINDARDHRLVGAETLIRWHHPERGFITPDLFIPVAERSGLIVEIGRYVIGEALRHLSGWHSFGFPPMTLSVNLSLRELESPDFIANLTALLYKYDIGESRLKLEITEHASMVNPELTHTRLKEIRQLGIEIALDDFGTGYSSFAHLAEFPIKTLKIDRSFVRDLANNPGHRHIVSTIIKLGHSLQMDIVAEGVETAEDAQLLQDMGADYLQGYYFSKPVPKLEFQYLLSHPAASS